MKLKNILQTLVLFAMLLSVSPEKAEALVAPAAPPVDMFQLPWELGLSWVAYDGFDNGSRRSATSPHNYKVGGAVDFAPHANMVVGEDTSSYWVVAAADGIVTTVSSCHVVIDHGNGWTTEYWHLGNIQVKKSDVVTRNQKIAIIADNIKFQVCTGNEHPGPHLHFVMRPNMKDTKFAGWTINFNVTTNITTFTKNGQTVNKYLPILNEMSFSGTPSPTRTVTSTVTATRTSTPTLTSTTTATSTTTVTNTAVSTNTPTITNIPISTNTPTITATPIFTNTNTATNTPIVTDTQTPTGTLPVTNTPTSTSISVSTNTPTVTTTPLITNTPTIAAGTSTFTNTPVVTNSPTITSTSIVASTNTPTTTSTPIGGTPTPTNTALPSGPYVLTDVTQSNLLVGEVSLVTVSLINVPIEGYTSAEFTCTYNQNLISVSNITIAGLFGSGPVVAINGPQNGSFILAMVGVNGNKATTSGPVFTFNASALQIGQTPVNCTARVSKGQSIYENIAFVGDTVNILSGTPTPTTTATAVAPLLPLLNGQVLASKPITIRLYNLDSTLAVTVPANPNGTFSFNAAAGSYTIVASATGFLNAQGPVTLTNGVTTTMPTINLIPGDVDGNSIINQLDALTIGMNYNGTTPTAADLNNDGVINVLDLQMLAAHYGQSGALVWQ